MHTGLSLHVYDGTQANASAVLVEDMVTESPSIGDIVSVLLHRLPSYAARRRSCPFLNSSS